MRWWKISAVLLGLGCIALAYRIFDQGTTRTYLEASQEASMQQIQLLTKLVQHEWLGLSEDQVMSRLRAYVAKQPAGSIVLKRESETNSIQLEGIRFEFRNGKLAKVS